MESFIVIAALLGLGVVLRWRRIFPEDSSKILADFVIWVPLPAIILLRVPELSISAGLLVLAWLPWVMIGLSVLMVLAARRLLRWNRSTTGAMLLLVPLGNTSFLGLPMVQFYFGEAGIPYALIYDQLGTDLAVATSGAFVLAAFSEAGRPAAGEMVSKVVTFPPFVVLVVAAVIGGLGLEYPAVVRGALELIAASLVPVIMLSVGLRLELPRQRRILEPLAGGLFLKLVASPLLAFWICRALAPSGLPTDVAIFEAGMPSMITAGALAIKAEIEPALAAAMVGYGVLLSFLTLSVLWRFLG